MDAGISADMLIQRKEGLLNGRSFRPLRRLRDEFTSTSAIFIR